MGMQARVLLDSGKATERDFAEVAARSLRAGAANPYAHTLGNGARGRDADVDALLAAPYVRAPLRAHDLAPAADGAAAVVLATAAKARELSDNPVFIRGIDHRLEPHQPGVRDLADSPSTRLAAQKAGLGSGSNGGAVGVAELHAASSAQELILRDALGLGPDVDVNPSGGPLCGDPVMATGLVRIIEAAQRVADGTARRAVAHAANGQALQHNLVCVLEGAR
jgi:acetyl-CoA acetyltransferase